MTNESWQALPYGIGPPMWAHGGMHNGYDSLWLRITAKIFSNRSFGCPSFLSSYFHSFIHSSIHLFNGPSVCETIFINLSQEHHFNWCSVHFYTKNCLYINHYVTAVSKSWCADVVSQTLWYRIVEAHGSTWIRHQWSGMKVLDWCVIYVDLSTFVFWGLLLILSWFCILYSYLLSDHVIHLVTDWSDLGISLLYNIS